MSLYSEKLENIIESLQVDNSNKVEKEKKISVNLNSHSREFKNIQFRSQMYKNSQVKKQEKENVVKEIQVKEFLDEDISNVYNRPWNKLENGFKKNRIGNFIDRETKEKNLTVKQKEKLKTLLYTAVDNKELNKINDVEYDIEEGVIEKVHMLNYNIENGYYTFTKKEPKKPKKSETTKNEKVNLLSSLKKKTESNRKKRESEKKKIYEHLTQF
tara:strand:- start:2088 stop:2729 length:642 start_codon:yes stop_codon:yes gene_type:complete